MRYWNITIWATDQYYLDKLADAHDIDYYDADIYLTEDTDSGDITNQLFRYVLTEAVYRLFISNKNKEKLQDRIYCKCLYSWFDINSDDVDEVFKWTKKSERKIIKEFYIVKLK